MFKLFLIKITLLFNTFYCLMTVIDVTEMYNKLFKAIPYTFFDLWFVK